MSYLPFVLAPGATINTLETPVAAGEKGVRLELDKLRHFYTSSAGPVDSLKCAEKQLQQVRASLLWISLKCAVGISTPKSDGIVEIFDEPRSIKKGSIFDEITREREWDEIDGQYNAHESVVRHEHKRLIRWETGKASISVGIGVENFFEFLHEALAFNRIQDIVGDRKLRLAIELYSAFRFEQSEHTQFITLVISLESLLPQASISKSS